MAPLTKDRNTQRMTGDVYSYPVAANAVIYAGALVALAAGLAGPGATAANLLAVGRAEEQVDNTGGADSAVNVRVRCGVYHFANSAGGDEIVAADVGADCFIVDDQTVAKTNGGATRSRAGRIVQVDGLGVMVALGITYP